jgi:GT2 family glycosyltransferase
MDGNPQINVCIPYDPEANLGREYNRLMAQSQREWMLFIDHDTLIMNPYWYYICQEAIRRHPDAGIFTVYTNSCGTHFTRAPQAPGFDASIEEHRNYARMIWNKNQFSVSELEINVPDKINGFFMLTSKTAWSKVGGFRAREMFGEDTDYHRRMIQHGIKCYRIDGIYVLHLHEHQRKDGSWISGIKGSRQLWMEFKERRATAQK